jgi:hypothetical protein
MELPRVALDDLNSIPRNQPDAQRHTWIPQSLIQLAQNPPAPPTIGNILYPGKRTLLSGETESLKTWLALILAKAEMNIENPVAWVDLDDMGAGAILQRLRAINVPDNTIDQFFLYYQPEQRLKDKLLDDVLMQLTVTGTRLMIIDAFNPALNLHGLDPNSTPDIETFWREIADPIAKTGTAPLLLDHVTKNAETRGKYAYGSERKASGATVHLGTHTLTTLAIGTTGRTILTVHKDRPGYLPRPTLGVLTIESDGAWITYKLDADKSHTPDGFRPTVLMEKVSRRLEQETGPVSLTWVENNVTGKRDAIRTAITLLHQDGHIEQTPGPRNTRQITSLNPYREVDEPTETDRAPTAPHRAPKLGQFGLSTPSITPLPLKGEGDGGAVTTENGARSPNPSPPNSQNGHEPDVPLDLILDTEPDQEADQ